MQIVSQLYGDGDDGELEHYSQTQSNGMVSHTLDRQKTSSGHGTNIVLVFHRR